MLYSGKINYKTRWFYRQCNDRMDLQGVIKEGGCR